MLTVKCWIRWWRRNKLRQTCVDLCSGVVLQVLFHPKQLMLVTSGDDADVRVWDLVNKTCVAVLKVLLSSLSMNLMHLLVQLWCRQCCNPHSLASPAAVCYHHAY